MYTVVAQQQIPLPVHEVWDHLTSPELLAKWFADTSPLAPGEPVRMDFGDGDFLSGRVVEWDPGIILGLRWRFIGHGPEYEVRYSMLRRKDGTELTVQDRGAITQEEAECLRVGWAEFLFRLNKAVVKNVNARFSWRQAFQFTYQMKAAQREALVTALTDPNWYHASLAGVHAQIRDFDENEINSVITHEAWGTAETRLRVKLKNIRGVDYAFFAHEGWPQLPGKLALEERRRFVTVWLGALAELQLDDDLQRRTAGCHTAGFQLQPA
jgi:uncharacterized protein YndB with AHSA1/START domain